jgi:hypothetical protein
LAIVGQLVALAKAQDGVTPPPAAHEADTMKLLSVTNGALKGVLVEQVIDVLILFILYD